VRPAADRAAAATAPAGGRLEPTPAAIVAPAKENEQYDDDEQKRRGVHDALLYDLTNLA